MFEGTLLDAVAQLRTVDSRYLEVQWTLWNTSRFPYLDISDLHSWGKNKSSNHISQNLKEYVIWLLKLEICWNFCGKDEKLLLGSHVFFFLFYIIFYYLLLYYHVKTWTRFSIWDKRLFEKSEVKATRVDWLYMLLNATAFLTVHRIVLNLVSIANPLRKVSKVSSPIAIKLSAWRWGWGWGGMAE